MTYEERVHSMRHQADRNRRSVRNPADLLDRPDDEIAEDLVTAVAMLRDGLRRIVRSGPNATVRALEVSRDFDSTFPSMTGVRI